MTNQASSIKHNPIAEVAVALPLDSTFHYIARDDADPALIPGIRVLVPFGSRHVTGYILKRLSLDDSPVPASTLKTIIRPLDGLPLFGDNLIPFFRFVSRYYHYPIGMVISEALPAGLKVMSRKTVRLTDEGREEAKNQAVEEKELHVLRLLDAGRDLKVSALLKDHGVAESTLKKLEKKNLVEIGSSLNRDRVKEKTQKWLSRIPSRDSEPVRIGRREKELLSLLRLKGPTAMDDLRDRFSGINAMARRLEEKGRLRIDEKTVYRDDEGRSLHYEDRSFKLSDEQAIAVNALKSAMDKNEYTSFLIHGVTGSGKTEVYLNAARHALDRGKTVLMLVPEISLTPALEGLVKARFQEETAVIHSGLPDGERYDQWIKIRRREVRLVLGARSAVFAPLENLGLIIVDEEHDGAYKQEEKLRYQARDLAVLRARQENAVVCLGSATPSLETYYAASNGRYNLLNLTRRVGHGVMPKVDIVDLRYDSGKRRRGALTPVLKSVLEEVLARGQQSLLFINRRGTAGLPICLSCGHVIKCLNCSVTLTLHQRSACTCESESANPDAKQTGILNCHHCGFEIDPPERCPECKSKLFKYLGIGTERLEADIKKQFPQARVARLDADVARRKGELRRILNEVKEGGLDILVGTQMITKGHDFPNITLVGVIEADLGLHLPDFRAGERTFQLLAQVGGRAGRGRDQGRVIVQTYSPDHYTLLLSRRHDYISFYREELEQRRQLNYPPFTRMALVRMSGNSEQRTGRAAMDATRTGMNMIHSGAAPQVEIMGPAPAPLARKKGKFRFQILVRSGSVQDLHAFLHPWMNIVKKNLKGLGVSLTLDVDPYSMM